MTGISIIRRVILTAVASIAFVSMYAQEMETFMIDVDWNEIKTLAQEDPGFVGRVCDRIDIQDTTLSYTEIARAYLAQSFLTADKEDNIVRTMKKAADEGEFEKSLSLSREALEINPVNIDALFYAAISIAELLDKGDTSQSVDEAQKFYDRMMTILVGIVYTGDGSEEHPFVVTKISDEYALMRLALDLYDYDSQSLVGHCDMFDLAATSDVFQADEIWFDATRILELENIMFSFGN